MKKQIKSYTALIPKEYLWGMAIAAPVAFIAINALLVRHVGLLYVLMCSGSTVSWTFSLTTGYSAESAQRPETGWNM
jgi:hypothetical protein